MIKKKIYIHYVVVESVLLLNAVHGNKTNIIKRYFQPNGYTKVQGFEDINENVAS